MAFKHGNHTLIDLDAGNDTKITSAAGSDIVFYPDQHIWIKQGTKLIFEGTVPDDFEAKLQATSVTADRDIILPDEDGTLATQAYVTGAVTGGALSNTDALAEGSTNLYYTNARANAQVDVGFATKTTTDLTEGTNLYHTDARALAATDGQEVKFKNLYDTLGDLPNATTYHGMFAHVHAEGRGYFAHAGNWVALANASEITGSTGSNLDLSGKTTDDLAEGSTNLYFSGKTTDDLAEGTTNKYFTNTRIDDYLAGGNGIAYGSGTIDVDNTVVRTSTAQSIAGVKTFSDNVIISGDLTVSGTTTTINTNELNVGDNIITLNSDETGAPSQNAGIEVERGTSTNVAIRWNESTDQWEFSNDGTTYVAFGTSATFTGTTDGVNEGSTNLYYTDARADARATLRINAATTDNISEGSTNLYHTNARALAATDGQEVKFKNLYSTTGDLPNATTYHGMFAHVHAEGRGYFAHAGNWVGLANQSEIPTIPSNISSFTNDSGYITGYTVTQSDVDARLSGGTGVTYSSGTISIGQSVATGADVRFDSLGIGTNASGTTGEIRATNDVTAYYSSDANLKTNVVNIENALDKVKQIRGVEFDWTQEYIDEKGGEDGYFVRKHDVGVIAQEVEAVLPEVVGTRENGTKAVRYDRLTALLIEAIKDQQSQIDELKQIITELGNK